MTDRVILEAVLDDVFSPRDLDHELTVREYLAMLLVTLFNEGEGFSGKRPFGNSGWEDNLVIPLIRHKAVKGSLRTSHDPDYPDDDEITYSGYDSAEIEKVTEELIYYMAGVKEE